MPWSSYGETPDWPLVTVGAPEWLRCLFSRRHSGLHVAVACHGTSFLGGRTLTGEGGFGRAQCRLREMCYSGACDDQMLGFGCYFGAWSKAFDFARRRASPLAERGGDTLGAVIVARLDLGHLKIPRGAAPCECCCGRSSVDHRGHYYTREGYDSLLVGASSGGATYHPEWALADPRRAALLGMEEVLTRKGTE